MAVIIRVAQEQDLTQLLHLFRETIAAVCRADYTAEQLTAWTAGSEDKERWLGRIRRQHFLVAEEEEAKLVGFCSLEGCYLDVLYVHKGHQSWGVASALYRKIEEAARGSGCRELTAEVSKTARRFFERRGFELVCEQLVLLGGVSLKNFRMRKRLGAS